VDGVQVDDRKLNASVSSSWSDTQRLLLHCQLEAAVVENDGMQILTQGLDYSKCLIGIVTDLHFSDVFKGPSVAYHNFETAEDLIKVFLTQFDVVCPTGAGVLNADDPNVAAIAEYCKGALTFFSQEPQAEIIQTHLAKGLRAVLVDSEEILLAEGGTRTSLCALSAIPALNTNASSRQANMVPILASVAAAWALNLPLELIRSGLQAY
jgi:cyanophycin synthetase